jgi:hypothetical protein
MGCLLAESPGPERKEWQSLSDIIRIEQERKVMAHRITTAA